MNLKAARGTDPCSLVIDCSCWDHVQEGPICKHAGAVLLALAMTSTGSETIETQSIKTDSDISPNINPILG